MPLFFFKSVLFFSQVEARIVKLEDATRKLHDQVSAISRSDQLFQFSGIVVSVLGIVVGAWVAWRVSKTAEKITRLQMLRANYDAWKDIDLAMLNNQKCLPQLGKIQSPANPKDDDEETQQKRLLTFLCLNPFYSYWLAINEGYIKERKIIDNFDRVLSRYLEDGDTYNITQNEVFVEGFAEKCRELKEDNKRNEINKKRKG